MNRQQLFRSLEFNYQTVINDKIETQSGVETNPIVCSGQVHLSLNPQISIAQLMCQTDFVNTFEQAGSQFLMHSESRIHDRSGHCIQLSRNWLPWCLGALVVHFMVSSRFLTSSMIIALVSSTV